MLFEAVLVSQAAGLLQAAGVLEQQQLCLREGFLAAGGRVTAGACKKQQNKATSLRLLLSASQTTLAREWRETATLAALGRMHGRVLSLETLLCVNISHLKQIEAACLLVGCA